ncbi:uncharacterized protein METZ01_LOCUS488393, partial [marine metagenome]
LFRQTICSPHPQVIGQGGGETFACRWVNGSRALGCDLPARL